MPTKTKCNETKGMGFGGLEEVIAQETAKKRPMPVKDDPKMLDMILEHVERRFHGEELRRDNVVDAAFITTIDALIAIARLKSDSQALERIAVAAIKAERS